MPNINSITATFVANTSDSCVLVTDFLQAFISGNDTICDNINKSAEVKIYFSGATPPFTFVYAINGVSQPSITTTINPYVIYTKEEGVYTLTSFANGFKVALIRVAFSLSNNPIPPIFLLRETCIFGEFFFIMSNFF